MARRKGELNLLLEELARAPWWVSVVVAAFVYIGLAMVLPPLASGGPVVEVVSGLAGPVAALFLIPGAVSALHVWRGRRMLVANRTKEAIRSLGWEEFEELIEAHYRRIGFGVRREPGGGPDGGVDVRLRKAGGETYLVQCKQWRARRVGVKVVRELFGVVAAEAATGGIVVTAGSFTREAEEFAKRVALELVDGDRLLDMMRDLPDRLADGGEGDARVEPMLCPRFAVRGTSSANGEARAEPGFAVLRVLVVPAVPLHAVPLGERLCYPRRRVYGAPFWVPCRRHHHLHTAPPHSQRYSGRCVC